jgi:4-amino-4-deoxy-L-arabinose transferase-like glycosyltransferase
MKAMDKYTKLAIWVIIIGIIIRFSLASIYHVSGDACWQVSNAIYIAENDRLPLFEFFGRDEPFWPPPLFHIVTAAIYKIVINLGKDIADFAIKMISPLLGSLTLMIFFLVAKIMFNKKAAFYAVLFLTFIPLHIDYSVFSYIDGTITFLAILSVYLALKNKIALSSIVAGLTILTKYNGIFIVPVLLYIVYKNYHGKKDLLKNILIISVIPLAIGSIWFLRNWIYLGNPVWPFLNGIFGGYEAKIFAEVGVGAINFSNLFSLVGISSFYLGIFGIPNGNINTLSFLQLPYMNITLTIWLLSTIIFIIPFFAGIASKKLNYKNLLYVWILSYLALIFLYVINSSWSVTRFILPAFPAIALIWAHGLEKIKRKKRRNAFILIILLIAAGFTLTSFVKISIGANSWDAYKDDFKWIKANTPKDSIFITSGQCIAYNIARQTLSPEINSLKNSDYIWVSQDLKLERMSLLSQDFIQELSNQDLEIVYSNQETKTKVYKIKK